MDFRLISDFTDSGDQAQAVKNISGNLKAGISDQVLLGVTGSGKTYTMARVIEETQLPTLVITHNKTLSAQLYSEFKSFFPENAVEYFVSYYDYYQPEAYIPHSDTYIEKDAKINQRIERLRLKATSSLLSRPDVIIVASVSCIYGLGSPVEWKEMLVSLKKGGVYDRSKLITDLASIQYARNDIDFSNGTFRVRGPVIDVFPAYLNDEAVRVRLDGDVVSSISSIHPLTGKTISEYQAFTLYPATHFVTRPEGIEDKLNLILNDLEERLKELNRQKKYLEAQRLKMRTEYDIEMLREAGYCNGIENYSRYFSGRNPGEPPYCLLNYFQENFLTILDESHVTLPQLKGMHAGDRSRKETLVEHGFRLPSALDNRPLMFEEFEKITSMRVHVSATPGPYEKERSGNRIIELINRPTGLVDPEVDIRPARGQVDDLVVEIKKRAEKKQRVLVTTITKKMAEDLAEYLRTEMVRVRYLHSEIDTIERINILKELRKGDFDCLVGVNLLREGLDLPEVALVAVLDADKEGFLRSETSLIQVCGRASRNIDGKVIMYAENITGSMKRAISEMDRRRKMQLDYNSAHGITPKSVIKAVAEEKEFEYEIKKKSAAFIAGGEWYKVDGDTDKNIIVELGKEMKDAARLLNFELAAAIRDRIYEIKRMKKEKSSSAG
ncbi:MAG: excinuclease ABC subunit UvrB [Elusimicrobiota bacterium]